MNFRNSTYWSNARHWQWATEPNRREKASFLKENILPIQQSGQLKFIEQEGAWLPGIDLFFANGHTDAQMIPLIRYFVEYHCLIWSLMDSDSRGTMP